ncbi:uncharacterized protein LOC131594124 [Vicia villosa]|uniref:uncharacterized protein LOC131594124 n=1 Tax=Vicia villosa TaxID=3911 RepID=UPI00273BE1CC|nr:uncharacterized protein LOC131594124 [Vicia villosa]
MLWTWSECFSQSHSNRAQTIQKKMKKTKNNFFTEKTKNQMKAWVPVKQVKTMESEKQKQVVKEEEEEKRSLEKEQQQEEKKKKILSSLPPNYVTLNQLRERWLLKQQNEINQQKQEDEEEKNKDHQPLKERHVAVMAPVNGNREDSAIERHAIGVDSEDGRKSVAGGEIGGGDEDLNGKIDESKVSETMKKKYKNGWRKRKAGKGKVEEKGAIEEGSSAEEKTIMRIESKDVKNSKSRAVDEVEQNFRVLSVKSGNGKQNRKFKKMNDAGFRQSQSMRNNRNGGGDSHGHGHGHGYGHGDSKAEMIWVKKDNNIGEIET